MIFPKGSHSSGKLRMQKDKMGVHTLTDLKGSEGNCIIKADNGLNKCAINQSFLGMIFSITFLCHLILYILWFQIDVDIEIETEDR